MIKRAFDLAASLLGLIVLAPLFVIVGVLIKLDSPGPVFFKGERIGQNGKPFLQYKFRTMSRGAEKQGSVTCKDDPRVTRPGTYLRQTKIDELPQLINVVKGEMSLVGPRPEEAHYTAYYPDKRKQVLAVKPGITGLAQLRYRDEASLLTGPDYEKKYREHILPQKLNIDLHYIRNRSFLLDLQIVLETLLPVKLTG